MYTNAYLATQCNERVDVKGIFFIYLKVSQNFERKKMLICKMES